MSTKQPCIRFIKDYDITLATHFKIHITVKLEYLFWTIEKIILNMDKFIVNGEFTIYAFKVMAQFLNFNILKKYITRFPSTDLDITFNPDKTFNYSYKDHITDKTTINTYQQENIYEANIVIYLNFSTTDFDKNCFNTRHTLFVLMEMFPDTINISSGDYPRFNFRANNMIYFALGDGADKEELAKFQNLYYAPIETDMCVMFNPENCNKYNNKISNKIGKNPCKLNLTTNKCEKNNLLSLEKLIYKNMDNVFGPNIKFTSIKQIYDFLGLDYNLNDIFC